MLLFVCRFPGQVSQASQLLPTVQSLDAKIESQNAKIDQNAVKTYAKIDESTAKTDAKIDQGIQETRELFKGMQKVS